MNVAPNRVSGRVVNTVTGSVRPSMTKSTSAPVERPIQLRCIVMTFAGHDPSSWFRSSSRRSA
jgi:hypothetical protein